MSRKWVIVLLSAIFLMLNCFSSKEPEQSREMLLKSIEQFYNAIERGDTRARVDLFAEDALVLQDGGPLVEFNDAVRKKWIGWDKEWVFKIRNRQNIETTVSGRVAYTINQYEYTFHRIGSTPVWHKTKNIHIWHQQKDGTWRLHVDIWNSSE